MRGNRYFKYKIVEYEYTSITYEGGKIKTDVARSLHQTNSKLLYLLLILLFKINRIKYEVISNGKDL